MRYNQTSNSSDGFIEAFKAMVLGTLIGSVFCVLFLCLFAFIFVTVKTIPQSMIQGLALLCAAIGAFVSGYVTIRIYRSKGLIYGTSSGILLFLIITIVGFIISRDKFSYITLLKFAIMALSGAIGGVLGVNRRYK